MLSAFGIAQKAVNSLNSSQTMLIVTSVDVPHARVNVSPLWKICMTLSNIFEGSGPRFADQVGSMVH